MKLKKIASLMLAGVMAVSMLSACGEGNGNGNEDENKPVETVSNAVTYANDMLDSDLKEYINFTSSTALDGWAAKYTTDTGKFSADSIKNAYKDTTTNANGWGGNYHNKMENQLKSDLKAANVLVVDDDTDFQGMPADKVSQSKGTVMVLSGMLDEKSAVETAVTTLGNWAFNNGSSVICPETVEDNDTVYNCDYTVEINAVKVTNDSLTTESAWVISMVINQKVTKAANTQV